MVTRHKVVEVARRYVGTPFAHQGDLKGVGIDCANFIANVAVESGATPDVQFENTYRRRADGTVMLALLQDYLEFIENVRDARPADVVAFHDGVAGDVPRHLGIITETEPYLKAAHASERGVVEHRLDLQWQRKIHSLWRIKGISDG